MKYRSTTSVQYRKLFQRLPEEIQEQAVKQHSLFCRDPLHPSLHLKPIGVYWSVRISQSYRALAVRTGDLFRWTWIGNHDDYLVVLKRQ